MKSRLPHARGKLKAVDLSAAFAVSNDDNLKDYPVDGKSFPW